MTLAMECLGRHQWQCVYHKQQQLLHKLLWAPTIASEGLMVQQPVVRCDGMVGGACSWTHTRATTPSSVPLAMVLQAQAQAQAQSGSWGGGGWSGAQVCHAGTSRTLQPQLHCPASMSQLYWLAYCAAQPGQLPQPVTLMAWPVCCSHDGWQCGQI